MTFIELQREVHYLLRDTNFLTNNDTQYVSTFIKAWINEGERQFCLFTDYGVEEAITITTTSGIQEYDLPNSFIREISVIYNNNYLSKDTYSNAILNSQITGNPYAYYLRMNKIGFIPKPSNAYNITLVYLTHGGNMSGDSDRPIIPETYQDVLIHYACMKAALQGDDARYKQFRELWLEKMQIARQQLFYRTNLNSIDIAGEDNTRINQDGSVDEFLLRF